MDEPTHAGDDDATGHDPDDLDAAIATMEPIAVPQDVRRDLRAYLRELAAQLHADMRQGDVLTLLVEASALAGWPVEQVPEGSELVEFLQHEEALAHALVDELEAIARDGSSSRARACWGMLLLLARTSATAASEAASALLAADPELAELHETPAWLAPLEGATTGDVWFVDVLDGSTRLWFVDVVVPGQEHCCLELEQDRLDRGLPRTIELLSAPAAELVQEAAESVARAHAEDLEQDSIDAMAAPVGEPTRADASLAVPALRDALAVARTYAAYDALEDATLGMVGIAGWALRGLVDQHLGEALGELDALGANAELKALAEHGVFATEATELTWWRDLGDDAREHLAHAIVALATPSLGELLIDDAHEAAMRIADVACDRFLDGAAAFTAQGVLETLPDLAELDAAGTADGREALAALLAAWEQVTRVERLAELAPGHPAPSPLAASPAAREAAVTALADVAEQLHLLDRRRRLMPGSDVDQAGIAMRMIAAMRDEGVDPSDPAQREAWMERWGSLDPDEQAELLGLGDD